MAARRLIAAKLRERLAAAGVQHHSYYQEEALDDEAAQRACTLLMLAANPEDRVALRFWLGLGSSRWLKGAYSKLRRYCEVNGVSPRAALEGVVRGQIAISGIGRLAERYEELLQALAGLADKKGEDLLNAVAPEGSADLELLRSALATGTEGEETAAGDFVERIRVAVTQPEAPEDRKCVRLMSLQKSKGLTSKVVVIAGCVEGLIPTMPGDDEPPQERTEALREQRRLFYVAITRPTERLVISSYSKMPSELFHQMQARGLAKYGAAGTVASRFLAELGPRAPEAMKGLDWLRQEGVTK